MLRELKNGSGGWTIERDYLYRGNVLLAAVQSTDEVFHLHPDHLGTPRLVTASGGTKEASHTYYPFGEEATTITQDTERLGTASTVDCRWDCPVPASTVAGSQRKEF